MTARPGIGALLLIAGLVVALGSFAVTSYSYYILVAVVGGIALALAGIGQITAGSALWITRLFAAIGIALLVASLAVIAWKLREPDLGIVLIGVVAVATADFVRSLRPRRQRSDQRSPASSDRASSTSATRT